MHLPQYRCPARGSSYLQMWSQNLENVFSGVTLALRDMTKCLHPNANDQDLIVDNRITTIEQLCTKMKLVQSSTECLSWDELDAINQSLLSQSEPTIEQVASNLNRPDILHTQPQFAKEGWCQGASECGNLDELSFLDLPFDSVQQSQGGSQLSMIPTTQSEGHTAFPEWHGGNDVLPRPKILERNETVFVGDSQISGQDTSFYLLGSSDISKETSEQPLSRSSQRRLQAPKRREAYMPMDRMSMDDICEKARDKPQSEKSSLTSSVTTGRKKMAVEHITLDSLQEQGLFDLPIQTAAQELGIGLSVLKRVCRQIGLTRWPFRTRQSLRGVIAKTNKYLVGNGTDCRKREVLEALQVTLDGLQGEAGQSLNETVRKYRQSVFKLNYKIKKNATKSTLSKNRSGPVIPAKAAAKVTHAKLL